jgi:hypothetical protein
MVVEQKVVEQKRTRQPKRVKLSPPPPLERLDDDWFDLPLPPPLEPRENEIPPKSC